MIHVGNYGATSRLLKAHGLNAKKKYGQNFLIDENILHNIVESAAVSENDHVIEIGPGIGAMTQLLCERAFHVTAVEIDKSLMDVLNETLSGYENVDIVNEDILKTDIRHIAAKFPGRSLKIVANLPYYITTPIVMKLLEEHLPIESITIMVQKEVADRMQASAGSKSYGALSLAVQYYARAYIAQEVSAGCFYPRPKVSSSVIVLSLYEDPPVDVTDEKFMFDIIRAAFNQRRKTLVNALSNAANLTFTKEKIKKTITACGHRETVRGEELSLEEFARLCEALANPED